MHFENVDWANKTLLTENISYSTTTTPTLRYYNSNTQKPQILFLHGFGQLIDSYAPFILALETHFSVIAPDLPGHGYSNELKSYTNNAVVSPILELIKQLKLTNFGICGHSLGCILAVSLRNFYPNSALALLTPGGISVKEPRIAFLCRFHFANAAFRWFSGWTYEMIKGQVKQRVGPGLPQQSAYRAIWLRNHEGQIQKYVNSQMLYLRDFEFNSSRNEFLRVKNGLFVLVEEDSYIDSQVVEKLVLEEQLGRVVKFQSIHSILSAIPVQVAQVVTDYFLEQISI